MQQQQFLDDRIALISVSASIFGGYRRATKEMIRELGGSLPDSKAVTQGSIKVFPGEALAPLGTLRRAAFRALGARGIKALGSRSVYAIPAEAREEIERELEQSEADFKDEVAKLEQSFDAKFEAYVKEAPEAEALLRRLAVDKADAMAKCSFSWTPFQITPLARNGQDQEKGVSTVLKSLGGQLFEEVADEFADILKHEGFVSGKVGQKFLRPIRAQVVKMNGLAFLEDSIPGAILLINETLAMLPHEGYIVGAEFAPLQKLVGICSDVETLVDAACRANNGVSIKDILFPPAPVVQAPVVEAVPVVVAVPVPVVPIAKPIVVVQAPLFGTTTSPVPVAKPVVASEPAAPIPAAPVVRKARQLMF